ncbi:Fe(II)-2OG oxygenase family protein [Chitinophaga tropicalis]|uniref:Taurine catabolism dioxygenase TauD n=1 Tax=Chitinophaga tropicalis TaxID=2683588 RepID=A0A7K1U0Y8_9BACT|nr:taurine catabolism dioxygenase TauD [Chitinophaga tropicalis]MVT07960.1 taurine catabolism dioxygenase TauD [Chitinophaga tropicalis]
METQILVQESILKQETNVRITPPLAPAIVNITAIERLELTRIGKSLRKQYGTYENPEYIETLHLNAYKILPERIARQLMRMGSDFSAAQYGAVVFKGLVDVDQDALGPTPPSWRELNPEKVIEYGFISSLMHGAVPSKPVEYFAQRKGGGLMHAIIPDMNMAYSQTGSGSRTELFVHTEDAFLFNAADFLSFLYLRNEEEVPSMLYSIRSHGRPGDMLKPLFEPIYKCPKDANYSHEEAVGEGINTSILYGNPEAPFIRFDAAEQIYNQEAGQSPEALENLKTFWNEARGLIYDSFIPEAGDLIFVNNHLCAHGRNAFVAGFRNENGTMVPCERRLMLRMMSKTSLIHIQSVAHPENPYMVMEEHYGKVYPPVTTTSSIQE